MQNLQLIVNSILILTLISYMGVEIKKIKSNKEIIKKDNEILTSYEELKDKLDLRNKTDKETYETIERVRENFEILKDNLTLDYDRLTEEVVKRINEKQKMNTNTFINV
ncbi:MAG: hypothetical protein ACLTK7_13795 [Clostridium paraputrificum]